MTDAQLNDRIPRLSWWKDVKGRTWVITGYTYNTNTWHPSQVEMLELYHTVPVYVDVLAVLRSVEMGTMKRLTK